MIRWTDDGQSFEILNLKKFGRKVLDVFFKQSKLNSFVRQLNMYDFHKRKRTKEEMVFYHNFFKQEHREMLGLIKRKTNSKYAESKVILAISKLNFKRDEQKE